MRRVVALIALAGCGDDGQVFAEPNTIELTFPSVANRKLDLLLVIYNSPGGDEAGNLANGVRAVIDAVTAVDGRLPDVHIGVTTTDLGTTGSIDPSQPAAAIGQAGSGGCAGAGDDGRLETNGAINFFVDEDDGAGGRRRNYQGELVAGLASFISGTGQAGCAFEQPLHAVRRALSNPANSGFVRTDAHLAIVIGSAEDDCSLLDPVLLTSDTTQLGPLQSFRCTREGIVCDQPIDEAGTKTGCRSREDSSLVEPIALTDGLLRGFKRDPSLLSVATIIGATSPFVVEPRAPPGGGTSQLALGHSCGFTGTLGLEVANPAVRLDAFARSFGGRGLVTSICTTDLSPAFREVGRLLKHPLGVVCLDSTKLTDSNTERGIQPACELTEIDGDIETRLLDFEISPDEVACPETADHLRLIVRDASTTPGAYIRARCETPY